MQKKILFIAIYAAIGLGVLIGCSDNVSDSTSDEELPSEEEIEPTAQEVGINVNGQYNLMKFENIDRSGTTWVRGFLDFFQLYPDESNIEEDKRIKNYIRVSEEGYKNIVSIKWNFRNKSFPEPGSSEMEDYKAYLDKLLNKIWLHTQIIVIGNEPFIESKREERGDELIAFYEEIGNHINNYRENAGRDIPIYVGAFNNLYLDGWRTQAVIDLFSFANSNSWIAGVDLHIHHAGIEQLDEFINYANLRIRDDQRILVSEFSLKDHFRTKMDEQIPEEFAEKYEWNPDTQNYEYLDYALKNQVPRQEWVDFLSSSYWFENRKNYLWNAYERFKSYDKFHIANYALRQSFPFNKDFTANIDPWILNGLFANRTVETDPETGQHQFNYAWIEDFTAIQEDSEN